MKSHWFHLMPYKDLPEDFKDRYPSVWVDVPSKLYDPVKGHEIYNEYLDELEYADRLGFDGICVNEHHSNAYGLMPSPNIMLACLARRTSQAALIVLGNSIALYNPPLRVAEEMAMLDVISGGRFVAGFPVGSSMDTNFAYGQTPATLREKYREAHDLIIKSWTTPEPFIFNGKYNQFRYVNVWPRPVQKPHPPVWITAQSPYALEAAVRRGFNVLTGGFGVSVDQLAEFGKLFSKVVAEVKPQQSPRISVQRAVYVADSEADAREAAEQARWNMRVTMSLRNHYERVENGNAIPVPGQTEPGIDDLLERFLVIGTPDTCIRQIRRLRELVGITHFNCSFWFGDMEQARVLRSMELFAKEVMPAVE
jgi:alkanesulfonate monooxygenase SsuD/methylene tetrahydromethanopterin reductase-like flavin-dependent oxidoreductase (luciferase family)